MSVLVAKPTLVATALVLSRAAPSLMSGVSLLKTTWWAACKIKDGIVYAKNTISQRYYSDPDFTVIEEEEIVDNDTHCAMCKQLLTDDGSRKISLIMFKGCDHRFHYSCLQNLRNVVTKDRVKGKCPKCNRL